MEYGAIVAIIAFAFVAMKKPKVTVTARDATKSIVAAIPGIPSGFGLGASDYQYSNPVSQIGGDTIAGSIATGAGASSTVVRGSLGDAMSSPWNDPASADDPAAGAGGKNDPNSPYQGLGD